MNDRDRLIELIVNADTYDSYECKLCTKNDVSCRRCGAEKFADYLLANGVIVPPCKVGDKVWFNTFKKNATVCVGIQPHIVDRIDVICVCDTKNLVETNIRDWEFGQSVFLTKAEAEKALKEREQ